MQANLFSRLLCLLAALASLAAIADTNAPPSRQPMELRLATNGRTEFSILIPARPSPTEAFAAKELQRYLTALSGAHFDIASKPAGHSIVVCQQNSSSPIPLPKAASALPAEAFCICREDSNLFLIGADPRGTLYAVYALLERLGCRWLAPDFAFYGKAAESVPSQRNLSLSLAEAVIEQPALKYRKLYVEEGHSHNTTNLLQMVDWMPKRRFNTLVVPLNYAGSGRVKWDNWRMALTPELQRRGIRIEVGGHGYENYLNAGMESGQLFKKHPEWFRMDETLTRVSNPHGVFCTSNPAARECFIHNVLDYLEARPEIEIFDFWPPDGAKWCVCPECKALGSPSDRQALLLAEVAAAVHKVRPALQFETIAYGACVTPPLQVAISPEVLVDFCPIGQCFEFQINDPQSQKNANYVSQLKHWLSAFKGDVSIYSYYRKYAWRSLPNLIPRYMQNDLRFYRSLGVRGISSYAEPGDWAAYELNHYVLGALAWNPDADVDALVREFAQARFGPQAALGLKAYQLLEQNVRHLCSLPGTSLKSPADYQRAAESFQALARELEGACRVSMAKTTSAALNRLALAVEYALRDLRLQQAHAENGNAAQRKAKIEELSLWQKQQANEGVFIVSRGSAAKQAARYGLKE